MGGKRIYTLFGIVYVGSITEFGDCGTSRPQASSFKSHCMTLPVDLPQYKFCMGASTAPDPPISVMKVSGLAAVTSAEFGDIVPWNLWAHCCVLWCSR